MHGYAVVLVLLSAILHASWNAQLKGSSDRSQFMANMSTSVGALALICLPFVPFPVGSAWVCIALSAVLHVAYNLLLLQNYRISDFSSAYPIARGISPLSQSCRDKLRMRRLDARDSTNVLELRGEPGNGRGGNTGIYVSGTSLGRNGRPTVRHFFSWICYGLSADERRGPGNPSVLCLATASSHLREGHGSPSRL